MEEQVQQRKVIVFQLQDESYALTVDQVGSIERMLPITRIPQAPDFVKGVINLRGVVTPVIDLKARFGMAAAEPGEASRIIVVSLANMEVGLIVDTANDVLDIPDNAIEPPPEVVNAVDVDYIEGVAKHDDRLIILLHLQNVLASVEMMHLKSVQG